MVDVAVAIALGAVTVLMGGLGFLVSTRPPKRKTALASRYERAFAILGAIGFVLVVLQAVRTKITGDRAQTAEAELRSQIAGLQTLTGGDAYAYVVPQTQARLVPIPLAIHNVGKYVLTGVNLTIHKSSDFSSGDSRAFVTAPEISVGVLYPRQSKMLKAFLEPQPDADGVDKYLIMISAQNGEMWENLEFRKGRYAANGFPWAYRFRVSRIEITIEGGQQVNSTVPVITNRWIWSDDAGEGRPVKTP